MIVIPPDKLNYIAGFFDGEGCVSGYILENGYPRVKISMGQKRSGVLYWIQEILKMGRICTFKRGDISKLQISGKKNVGRFIDLILPHSIVKKEELIIGQRLNNLVGLSKTRKCSLENRQGRMILYKQLKLLKKRR